jgi:hypothetical protein
MIMDLEWFTNNYTYYKLQMLHVKGFFFGFQGFCKEATKKSYVPNIELW